jgi:catechol-2,3-dioxygenase
VDDWKARFEELGIPIEHYHRWPNDSYSVYIRDPAGNSVEVGEGRLWGFE